jgi:hypothetical protein
LLRRERYQRFRLTESALVDYDKKEVRHR